jgi:hypothetical protein
LLCNIPFSETVIDPFALVTQLNILNGPVANPLVGVGVGAGVLVGVTGLDDPHGPASTIPFPELYRGIYNEPVV